MRAAERLHPVSVEDYLAGELVSTIKHEYLGGVIYAMAGGRNAHNLIASNLLITLGSRLRGKGCRAYNSDTKIRIDRITGQDSTCSPGVGLDRLIEGREHAEDADLLAWPNEGSALAIGRWLSRDRAVDPARIACIHERSSDRPDGDERCQPCQQNRPQQGSGKVAKVEGSRTHSVGSSAALRFVA
jgi:hypothetical protein